MMRSVLLMIPLDNLSSRSRRNKLIWLPDIVVPFGCRTLKCDVQRKLRLIVYIFYTRVLVPDEPIRVQEFVN